MRLQIDLEPGGYSKETVRLLGAIDACYDRIIDSREESLIWPNTPLATCIDLLTAVKDRMGTVYRVKMEGVL